MNKSIKDSFPKSVELLEKFSALRPKLNVLCGSAFGIAASTYLSILDKADDAYSTLSYQEKDNIYQDDLSRACHIHDLAQVLIAYPEASKLIKITEEF